MTPSTALRRFLAAMMVAAGVLVFGTGGLCVGMLLMDGGTQPLSAIGTVLYLAGIPFGAGGLLVVLGVQFWRRKL